MWEENELHVNDLGRDTGMTGYLAHSSKLFVGFSFMQRPRHIILSSKEYPLLSLGNPLLNLSSNPLLEFVAAERRLAGVEFLLAMSRPCYIAVDTDSATLEYASAQARRWRGISH